MVPTYCPIFGIKLVPGVGRQSPNSPSLDRIIPKKGYVPGNVQVISWRANSLKKDANLRELADLGQFAVKALEARRGRACGLR